MWDYIANELTNLIGEHFAIDLERQSITGHSMGGHGALTMAMGLSDRFKSVSAFAPISNPTGADWGRKQLAAYLGDDEITWQCHDASVQMRASGCDIPMLVDWGTNDQFIDLLRPEALMQAAAERRHQGTFRLQQGYDHSYFFVSSFMQDHITFHADALYSDE
jgi:S-formylglutathione hydrolase